MSLGAALHRQSMTNTIMMKSRGLHQKICQILKDVIFRAEKEKKKKYALKINEILTAFFAEVNIELIDFKLEFGRLSDGTIVLADEISPDTCRFWDSKTHEKLDKDRFRRDLGNVEGAYHEILHRLMGE